MEFFELEKIKEPNIPCKYTIRKIKKFSTYDQVIEYLSNKNYDDYIFLIDENKQIRLIYNSFEEYGILHEDYIELVCDGSKVKYSKVKLIFDVPCKRESCAKIIETNNSYCSKCLKKLGYNYDNIDFINKLSVSKKIKLILSNEKRHMTSKEIYEKGIPWNITGETPKNTIVARCSTLYNQGIIKKEKTKYYL